MAKGYNLEQTGPQVQEAINKSLNLTTATQGKDGLMSAQDKQKLDSLDSELAGKVDKVPGKGLSTNDYDNTEKGKVASAYQKPVDGIPASDLAEGVIPDTSQFITKTVNDLANYYLKTETYSRSETYTKAEVDALIVIIKQFTYQVVSELPEASEITMYKLYLVPSADPQTQNVKDEYITVRSGSEGAYTYAWEQIGSTAINLSGYVTTEALNAALANYTTTANLTTLLAAKQDVIPDLETIRSGAAAGATSVQPAEFNELKDEVDTIGNGAYEEAWDGDSTPVVADIPAGVVVTYSSASYTGTLAASASTVDKIYLVSDGNGNYDRYTTVEANGAYSWKKVGSTAIPLSNYATKTQANQLEQEATKGAELSTIATTNLNKFRINNDCLTFDQITANHWYVRYIPVTKGDIVYLTASNSSAQPIKYGFSENQPADGVAVIDGVYLTSVTSVDVLLFAPVTGYFAYACYDAYFTDAVVKRGTASSLAGVVGNLVNADSNRFVKNDNTRQYISEENKNTIAYNLGLDAGQNLVQKYINNITLGYYVNDSGVLTRLANTANIKIPIDNTLGYMFVKKLGAYANVNISYRFFDSSDNLISYTFNNGNSAAPNQGNGLYIVKLPADVSYIRINVEPGKENLVQVYQEIPVTDEYTDRELITDKASQISIGHIFSTTGEVEANNNLKNTAFIPCNTGDAFRVADWCGSYAPDQFTSGVGCYFDANMGYLGVVEADTEVYDWVAPEGAKYVSFIYAINDNATISIKRITTTSIKGKILPSAVLSNSMWNGKIWVGFGASMVAQSSSYVGLKWSPMVEAATGLVFKNCGIGGTPLAGDYTNAFWKRIQPVIDYNPDVVTILGGYNDLYYDIPLGTSAEFDKDVAEKDCETFLGAYSYIIETLLNWKKSLRIVLMTPSYAHTNGADHTPGIGLTYKDYADATIQVAEYYCLPVIDLYRNMGINKLTQGTTYTRGDKIHWNARASQIAASLIIAKLEEINNAVPTE